MNLKSILAITMLVATILASLIVMGAQFYALVVVFGWYLVLTTGTAYLLLCFWTGVSYYHANSTK